VTLVVGVHGIKNEQRGRNQLLASWAPALADGLERAADRAVAAPSMDVAFYGDLFLDGHGAGLKGPVGDDDVLNLAEDEVADLSAALDEAGEPEAADEMVSAVVEEKGYSPRVVQALLRRADRRFGSHATGLLFLSELRQVRRYLRDPVIKTEADARVGRKVTSDCQVVVAHSLGSVVAFEYLRQYPDRDLNLLVTLGSPLGLNMVRRLMPDAEYGSGYLPENLTTWVNVRDPRDPVACAGDLSMRWPGINDEVVDNGNEAHSVERYLGKKATGEAIWRALPEESA
jgi:pimeloyl-ACP methyl ester carboxylesterase